MATDTTQSTAHEKLTDFLANTLNDILKIEDNLLLGRPDNVSFKEMHVIEALAAAMDDETPARATDIAKILRITPGTLTSSMDSLEKKGYLKRIRDANDRRSVRVAPTESAKQALALHRDFHGELAGEILSELTAQETEVLMRCIGLIQSFYAKKAAKASGKVKILIDSSCDMSAETAAELGIQIISMSVLFGDDVYRQGIDLSASEFYAKMAESTATPTTVQLTPFDLEQIYREAAADGSEIVAIHLSSALSGTFQSAVLASREVSGVYPVDSHSASFGISLLGKIAAGYRDAGMSASEIADIIGQLSNRVTLYAYIPTLKYLVRGGRLSATAGLVGTMLNVYPIISVTDGMIKNVGKARGKRAAQRELEKFILEKGIDTQYGVSFGHAASADDMAELKAHLRALFDGCEVEDCEVGALIGTHTGPGAVGFAFIRRL